MKSRVMLWMALTASAAAAVDVETLNGPNLLGLTRVESAAEYLPLGVVWGAVGLSDAAPAADAFLVTSCLEPGDALYVYDRANSQYRVFELERTDEGDRWQPREVVQVSGGQFESVTGAAADATALAVGYGAWLHRPGAATRASRTVLALGQVRQAGVTVELAAAPVGKAFGQTLFGVPVPASGDFKLNGGSVDWAAAGAAKGDEIRVPQADGSLETIRYDGAKWVRRYYDTVNGVKRPQTDSDPALAAGTAVWYARKAGGGAMTLAWEGL